MTLCLTRFLVWSFLYLSAIGAAAAHDVDMPPWVKGSATCSIDIHSQGGAVEIELDLNRQDAVRLAGDQKWKGKGTLARIAQRVKPSFFLNGQIPSEVLVLERSARFERWLLKWPAPVPASFELKTNFFQGLASPAWCRVFMFPNYGDPERSFFFLSDKSFRWPEAENPAPSPSTQSVWGRFFILGYSHILPEGLDHILFVLGLCLAASRWGALIGQITAFTLAHTLSLGLAAGGIISLHSHVVEPLIAASIALVAVENLARRETPPWRWMVVFGFGLIHGLGFAGALRETGLPSEAFLQSLFAFNLGVEAGQLTIVVLVLILVWRWRQKKWYRQRILVPASGLIALVGLFWAFQRL